jgi:hypothetical protein
MEGLETVFFTILSMPMFSVSVFATMHKPSGLSLASFSSSLIAADSYLAA